MYDQIADARRRLKNHIVFPDPRYPRHDMRVGVRRRELLHFLLFVIPLGLSRQAVLHLFQIADGRTNLIGFLPA